MNKEKCDHIIGVHSYAWSLKTQSKNKLHPEYGSDYFNYCPLCGEKLNKENENESNN